MIKNVQQLKELILWAKAEKVKSFSIADISVELSDLALISDLSAFDPPVADSIDDNGKKQVVKRDLFESQTETAVTDEDLFWSAQN